MDRHIPIFAHRGASGHALENTLTAFEKAKKLGATGIEIDVQRTKDNVLVVFHDLDLYRLTGINKKISECTYSEISEIPIGKTMLRRKFSKECIPTLQQVLDWAKSQNMPLNIELKQSLLNYRDLLINLLHRLELPQGSHFSSFHEELLQIVKMQRVDFETALIITRKFDWDKISSLSYVNTIHAHKIYYKSKYLEAVKQANVGIRFYSIRGNESYLHNPDPSVIGWITDYPKKVVKAQKSSISKRRSTKGNEIYS